jgi:hypothetical protein
MAVPQPQEAQWAKEDSDGVGRSPTPLGEPGGPFDGLRALNWSKRLGAKIRREQMRADDEAWLKQTARARDAKDAKEYLLHYYHLRGFFSGATVRCPVVGVMRYGNSTKFGCGSAAQALWWLIMLHKLARSGVSAHPLSAPFVSPRLRDGHTSP